MTREEIAKATNQSNNGNLGDMLLDLVYCDFVRKIHVRDKKVNVNSAIYQLVDFYTIFYNTFANKAATREHFWMLNVGTPTVNNWYGLAFERVCKAHIPQIKQSLGITSVSTEHYAWRSKRSSPAAQIDIITLIAQTI